MPRNLYRRVEIAFPIENPALRKAMIHDMLPAYINDRVKARELQPDGSYVRLKPGVEGEISQAQLHFREQARRRAVTAPPQEVQRLSPLAKP